MTALQQLYSAITGEADARTPTADKSSDGRSQASHNAK
jgi:hypothetical protein